MTADIWKRKGGKEEKKRKLNHQFSPWGKREKKKIPAISKIFQLVGIFCSPLVGLVRGENGERDRETERQ